MPVPFSTLLGRGTSPSPTPPQFSLPPIFTIFELWMKRKKRVPYRTSPNYPGKRMNSLQFDISSRFPISPARGDAEVSFVGWSDSFQDSGNMEAKCVHRYVISKKIDPSRLKCAMFFFFLCAHHSLSTFVCVFFSTWGSESQSRPQSLTGLFLRKTRRLWVTPRGQSENQAM